MRLGLVGCGQLAEQGYLPAIARTAALDLVAVADPDPARRAHVAALAGDVAALPTAAKLLGEVEVDALVLASPAETHVTDARIAGEAGIAVLVEKPPAPDAAGAAELADLHPPPHVGFNRRFDPAVRAVRDAVPADGDVELDLVIHYRRRSWAARSVHDDAIVDLGPHLVDLARWLTGAEVVAVTAADLRPDRATVELELTRGHARLRAAADRLHRELIEVRQGRNTVARHSVGGPLAAVTGRLAPGPHPLVASLAGQLAAFARTLTGNPDPDLGTADDGLAVMTAIDAARAVPAPARS
jgi:predicted dehydrogenase